MKLTNIIEPKDCKWYRVRGKFHCKMYGGAVERERCRQQCVTNNLRDYICPDFTPKTKEK